MQELNKILSTKPFMVSDNVKPISIRTYVKIDPIPKAKKI
jgi:hypothetical protein